MAFSFEYWTHSGFKVTDAPNNMFYLVTTYKLTPKFAW